MSLPLSPDLRRALAERIRYYQQLGIYDFYRREGAPSVEIPVVDIPAPAPIESFTQPEQRETMSPKRATASAVADESMFEVIATRAETAAADPVKALKLIRDVCKDNGSALLLVSHDREVLGQFEHVAELAKINAAARVANAPN